MVIEKQHLVEELLRQHTGVISNLPSVIWQKEKKQSKIWEVVSFPATWM